MTRSALRLDMRWTPNSLSTVKMRLCPSHGRTVGAAQPDIAAIGPVTIGGVLRWDGLDQIDSHFRGGVVTIGVFDGVHRGHRALIRTALESARRSDLSCTVLTFDPNPAEVVGHGAAPTRLATMRQRVELIAALGADHCVILKFDDELAQTSAERFVSDVLVGKLAVARVVVGENFRFGRRARGDVEMLELLGRRDGFEVTGSNLVPVTAAGEPISSSLVRRVVAEGDVAGATRLLARPHRLEGEVVKGAGRGQDLGFPTANVQVSPSIAMPADGVYAGRLAVDPYRGEHKIYPTAISVGTNPTFDGTERQVEAFAYNEVGLDLYGRDVAVDFIAKLRDQERFDTPQELTAAMTADVANVRRLLGI